MILLHFQKSSQNFRSDLQIKVIIVCN